MRKLSVFLLLLALTARIAWPQSLDFAGASLPVVEIKAEASTGLNGIYVLADADGVEMSLHRGGTSVRWSKFGAYGAAYAEEAAVSSSLRLSAEDSGYVVEDGDKRYYFWVVNYANHELDLQRIYFADEQECDRTHLLLEGNASPVHYYTINGQRREISRELELTYNSLEYDASAEAYVQKDMTDILASIDGGFSVPAPLCDTYFTLTGDRFLKQWGEMRRAESEYYATMAVEAHTSATQETQSIDNQQNDGSDGLGGSAPCSITFTAAVTDAAIFVEWQLSTDPEFNTIDDRYRQLEFDYTFRDNGTAYVRFVCDNDAGACEYIGETYEIFIGESALLCPNAFSPGASEGVNDEWKVSYKSIVKYECHIFNRWGTQLFSSTDPARGWDGKYKGKLVPSGAYYYVIKAVGSDGKKYNLSGDINILHSKTSGTSSTTQPEE